MGRPDSPRRTDRDPWGTQYYNSGLLALTVNDDGTATGGIVDTATFMWLRNQRFTRHAISTTDEQEQQASVTETDIHPAEVANSDFSLGAAMTIGLRVQNCRSSYTPPESDPNGEGILWLADHESRSWARLHHDPGSDGPYRVYQFGPRTLWDEVAAAHRWWAKQGRPETDSWVFTVTPQGQRIELPDSRT
ncbi:MAG: hypothetical protein ACT4NY_22250 [Pseudonocardiales bacterium]